MAHSFSELKSSRAAELAKLNSALDKLNSGGGGDRAGDDRYWSPTVDKAGNGYAVFRWLPAPDGEDLPFIRYWDHGFKGPTGQWYIENSLTSIEQEDPVAEMNRKLWQEGENSTGQEFVRGKGKDKPGSKRRLHYVSGIYMIADPVKKDNNGKVFLYKYGAKVFGKANDAMNPPVIEGIPAEMQQKAINPFDLWEGANFQLKIRQVEGYRNYDTSVFDTAKPLLDDDAAMEAIWKSEYPLKELLDPKNFKSYAELKAKLERVMANGNDTPRSRAEDRPATEAPKQRAAVADRIATAPVRAARGEAEAAVADADANDDNGDDATSYFEKLANG